MDTLTAVARRAANKGSWLRGVYRRKEGRERKGSNQHTVDWTGEDEDEEDGEKRM